MKEVTTARAALESGGSEFWRKRRGVVWARTSWSENGGRAGIFWLISQKRVVSEKGGSTLETFKAF
jgi:hypothetical protein